VGSKDLAISGMLIPWWAVSGKPLTTPSEKEVKDGQHHVTLYTSYSILALMPLEYERYKVQSVYIVLLSLYHFDI
jgi:hypothetical protein